LSGIENGLAIGQDNVATDAQSGNCLSERDRFCEACAIRHEGGRGDDASGVSFKDGAIDSGGKAEVIGIDDQAAHRVSLAGAVDGPEAGEGIIPIRKSTFAQPYS
jgi:hypothetical protein